MQCAYIVYCGFYWSCYYFICQEGMYKIIVRCTMLVGIGLFAVSSMHFLSYCCCCCSATKYQNSLLLLLILFLFLLLSLQCVHFSLNYSLAIYSKEHYSTKLELLYLYIAHIFCDYLRDVGKLIRFIEMKWNAFCVLSQLCRFWRHNPWWHDWVNKINFSFLSIENFNVRLDTMG